jgi:hypothetical protein
MQSPEAVARSWYERVWNQKDRNAIAEMLAPDGVFHDGAIVTVGVGPFQQFYDRMHAALSDIHIEVEDTVVQGTRSAFAGRRRPCTLVKDWARPPQARRFM